MSNTAQKTQECFLESQGREEIERLHCPHDLMKYYLGGDLLLPGIEADLNQRDSVEVLDSGTSDGHWMRDVSPRLPKATFTGTDLSSTFFPIADPDKFTYQLQDVLKPWPESFHHRFDLVHQRHVLIVLRDAADFATVLGRLADTVKPGGWIQLQEIDTSACPSSNGPYLTMYADIISKLSPSKPADYSQQIGPILRQLGFDNIQEKFIEVGTGASVGDHELGMAHVRNTVTGVRGIVAACRGKGLYSDAELDALLENYQAECEKQGGFIPGRIFWGRKRST